MKLEKPIEITTKTQISEIDIISIVDVPEKKVVAELKIGDGEYKKNETLILWENKEDDFAYDNIGDWTQDQAEKRIIELLTK